MACCFLRTVGVAVIGLVLTSVAFAQAPAARFDINGYAVEGAPLLRAEDFSRLVSPFIGKQKTAADVQKAQQVLQQAYLDLGHCSVQVTVPRMEPDAGTVVLRLVQMPVPISKDCLPMVVLEDKRTAPILVAPGEVATRPFTDVTQSAAEAPPPAATAPPAQIARAPLKPLQDRPSIPMPATPAAQPAIAVAPVQREAPADVAVKSLAQAPPQPGLIDTPSAPPPAEKPMVTAPVPPAAVASAAVIPPPAPKPEIALAPPPRPSPKVTLPEVAVAAPVPKPQPVESVKEQIAAKPQVAPAPAVIVEKPVEKIVPQVIAAAPVAPAESAVPAPRVAEVALQVVVEPVKPVSPPAVIAAVPKPELAPAPKPQPVVEPVKEQVAPPSVVAVKPIEQPVPEIVAAAPAIPESVKPEVAPPAPAVIAAPAPAPRVVETPRPAVVEKPVPEMIAAAPVKPEPVKPDPVPLAPALIAEPASPVPRVVEAPRPVVAEKPAPEVIATVAVKPEPISSAAPAPVVAAAPQIRVAPQPAVEPAKELVTAKPEVRPVPIVPPVVAEKPVEKPAPEILAAVPGKPAPTPIAPAPVALEPVSKPAPIVTAIAEQPAPSPREVAVAPAPTPVPKLKPKPAVEQIAVAPAAAPVPAEVVVRPFSGALATAPEPREPAEVKPATERAPVRPLQDRPSVAGQEPTSRVTDAGEPKPAAKPPSVVVQAAPAASVVAQAPALADPASAAALKFDIDRYLVEGNTLLNATAISRVLGTYTGKQKDFADVQRALEALQIAYQKAGWGAVQVTLPEQELERGEVRFEVVETRIGKIEIQGNEYYNEANVRRSVPALKPGEAPNLLAIARSLKVANENAAKQTQVSLKAGSKDGEVDAAIKVVDDNPRKYSISMDNTGTSNTGQLRLGFGFQHSNVWNRDHQFTFQYITNPDHVNKVTVLGAGYRIPLYERGDSIDLILGYSDVDSGTVQQLFNVSGAGLIVLGRYNRYLNRIDDYEHKLTFGIDYKAFQNRVLIGNTALVPDITLHPVSLSYSGELKREQSAFNFYASLTYNPFEGGNDAAQSDFAASRGSGGGASAEYVIWRYGLNYQRLLPDDWTLRVSANAQTTRNALVAGEQFGLGGANSVRGFNERTYSNDKGHQASVELYTPDLAGKLGFEGGRLKLLAFYDTGSLSRNFLQVAEQTGLGVDSIGIGLRMTFREKFNLRMDYAQVMHDGGQDAGIRDGRRNSNTFHASAAFVY